MITTEKEGDRYTIKGIINWKFIDRKEFNDMIGDLLDAEELYGTK